MAGPASWDEVEPVVAALVGPVSDPQELGGSTRSGVWRVEAGHASYVVKACSTADGAYAREAAALHALTGTGVGPDLVAADDASRLLVMEDLRGEGDLADALLGQDRPLAAARLEQWAHAIARLHLASTEEVQERFTTRLRELDPTAEPEGLTSSTGTAVDRYREELPGLGVDPAGALEALVELPGRLGPARVLSPTDACPDNNLASRGVVRLVDFEGARLWHPAWDVAYLRVPFPSCWCAWSLPAEVSRRAEQCYREATRPGPRFDDDLALVTLGWCVISAGWFLPRALRPEDGDDQDPRIPARRQMVQHRLGVAAGSDADRDLAAFAGRLHERLSEEWGEVVLPLGPVWRGTTLGP